MAHSLASKSLATCRFFLCDIQDRFRPLIAHMDQVIYTASTLIKAAHILNIPIIATEQYPKAFGRTVPELTGLLQDSKHAHLATIYEKTRFSMLRSADDAAQQHSVVFGIESHVCVQQTVLDLLRHKQPGSIVTVVADGASSQRLTDRKIAIELMRQAGARITTTESLLLDLIQDAKHPQFKEMSNLLKEHNAKATWALLQ